jgi:hypothetical protein
LRAAAVAVEAANVLTDADIAAPPSGSRVAAIENSPAFQRREYLLTRSMRRVADA